MTSLHQLFLLARRPAVLGAFAACWAFLWLLWWAGYVITVPAGAGTEAGYATFDVASWGLVCVTGIACGWMMPVSRRPGIPTFAAVLLLGVVLVSARIAVAHWVAPWLGWQLLPFRVAVLINLPRHLLVATSCIGMGCGVRSVLHDRAEAARLAALEADVLAARLQGVRMHLRPAFLLESLSAISARIGPDPRAADRLLVQTSELLRAALLRSREERVTLREEMDYLRLLLETDALRTGARVELRDELPPEARALLVPPGTLTLPAETLSSSPDGARGTGVLAVRGGPEAGKTRLELHADGFGERPSGPPGGDGVEVVRELLWSAFGNDAAAAFSVAGDGRMVTLELPPGHGTTPAPEAA